MLQNFFYKKNKKYFIKDFYCYSININIFKVFIDKIIYI